MDEMVTYLLERAQQSCLAMSFLKNEKTLKNIAEIIELLKEIRDSGGCIFACGNGGSFAQADHFTTELVVRFEKNRNPIKAHTLGSSSSIMTAICNDLDAVNIFYREFVGLASEGDVLLVFTTSGSSRNVIKCLEYAHQLNIKTIIITSDRFTMRNLCDISVCVPFNNTGSVQEVHLAISHLICAGLDSK